MTEPRIIRRRVRRQTMSEDGSVNAVADVNMVVSTGGSSSSKQAVRVVQRGGGTVRTETDEDGKTARTGVDR